MRPRRLVLLGLLAAAAAATVVYWPWIDAQRRAVIVLSGTSSTPVLSWAVRALTSGPKIEETTVGDATPATLFRPAHGSRWPAVMLLPGTANGGRENASVVRLARALARAGFLVVVPDLPGMVDGEIVEATVRATVDAALDVAHRPDVSGGQVAFAGGWAGASVALLAAENPLLAPYVSVVAGVAPWSSYPDLLLLATTGFVRSGRSFAPYEADPYIKLVAARSLVAALAPSADRDQLLALLQGVARTDPDPLRVVRGLALGNLAPDAAAVVSLLSNTNAPSFDTLYAALPDALHLKLEQLSPAVAANELQARVELASAPHDRFIPPVESTLLAHGSPLVHVIVTGGVKDGLPSPSIGDAFSTDGFVVQALKAAR